MWDVLQTAVAVLGGGFGGALLRFAPEVLSFFKRKMDYKQERDMRILDGEIASKHGAERLAQIIAAGEVTVNDREAEAYTLALKAQTIKTGSKFFDGLNVSVRPITHYFYLLWFAGSHVAMLWVDDVTASKLWGPPQDAIIAGLLSFWFVNRVFFHQK